VGLVVGKLYLVKYNKEWEIAMFTGFQNGRGYGVDWRWSVWLGPDGVFHIPASETFLTYRELPDV
jgi:hypothetical protein